MITMDRRAFLSGVLALPAFARLQQKRLGTFSDWMKASETDRASELQVAVDRIREADQSIHAWVQVRPERPTSTGRLSEIPFGVKDIIETEGLATEYGSPVYKGRIGKRDAGIVRELRQRGGVLMGKTHTTAFAYRTPAPTRNPRDLAHTPGGSSSGSAAAVAASMVPLALGTQTGGSVLRPASYCGVAGFKTTFGHFSMEGVLPFAKSLDTLGFFTHTAGDMMAFWEAFGQPAGRAEEFPLAASDPIPDVEAPMTVAFQNAVSKLRRAGITVRSIDIATMLSRLAEAQRTIMFYEGARFHEERYKQYGDELQDMAALVREGLQMRTEQYDAARRFVDESRQRVAEFHKATPVILVPAATGPAPLGLASTGDSRMNAPWTALGTPAISIPMPVDGLPLGLQLTAAPGEDARLIREAVRVERILGDVRIGQR
jgi:Asp-tRNA(Asn)/Glu-tRNA(Gln) amidotransferase A subunit family amidase